MSEWLRPEDDQDLYARTRNVLVGLAFLAEGRTASYDSQSSHGKSESTAPSGNDDGSELDHVREALVKWLKWAEEKLQTHKVKAPSEMRELRDIILTDHKDKTARQVAEIEKVSVSYVMKIRAGKR